MAQRMPMKSPRELKYLAPQKDSTAATDAPSQTPNAPADAAELLNLATKAKYVKEKKIGQGTYANVYKGHLASDPSQLVAIKKIKVNAAFQDGLALDAIREMKCLQELAHPNIIALHAVFSSKAQNLNMVLEFLPQGDLETMIKDTSITYTLPHMKAWMSMLCGAVWFCHENYVLHRDIKPNNLLIAADGEMKLADFGLARSFADPGRRMSHQVITLWYRPPELFYQARHYSGAVDVWSVGCVFAELIRRVPWMPGTSDLDQLSKICDAVGTPTDDNWPGVSSLSGYIKPEKAEVKPVRGRDFYEANFSGVGTEGVGLLMEMLKLDPRKRITARQTLRHPWWTVNPRPATKEELPKKGGGVKAEEKMGDDLKRRGGELGDSNGKGKIARKLNFG
ncbi:hypothetical protein FH972_020977 [Carpinus fangiana]|uniref:Protein kinase domain-containing protein n=1 Tax=Carpinus fangiana TaxID=176857 RepID=A0A5N6KND4_9ROSI|nr:hypothetical protein FH972_020977 [Carpinus fangiana]